MTTDMNVEYSTPETGELLETEPPPLLLRFRYFGGPPGELFVVYSELPLSQALRDFSARCDHHGKQPCLIGVDQLPERLDGATLQLVGLVLSHDL